MPRVVSCPVARWPGEVVLAEPLSWPQYLAWQRAVLDASAVAERDGGTQAEYDAAIAPGIAAVVLEWRLTGNGAPDGHGIPATPRKDSSAFIAWLLREVSALINGEGSPDPNL